MFVTGFAEAMEACFHSSVWVALKRAFGCCFRVFSSLCLLGAGVLGDGLGALRHGVLGQLTGQKEADGGLDLPGSDGGALVVVS